jgi:hypothetical protein
MFKQTLISTAAIAGLCISSSLMAGSWTVTQQANLPFGSSIEQGASGSVTNSTQSVNSIDTDGSDTISNSVQTVNSGFVSLDQGGGATTSSTQALNKMTSPEITGNVTRQRVNAGVLNMDQYAGGGSNIQAGNLMEGNGKVALGNSHVAQRVDSLFVNMHQVADTSLQAGNAVISASTGNNSFRQQFSANFGLGMSQHNTTGSEQYGNYGGSNVPSN